MIVLNQPTLKLQAVLGGSPTTEPSFVVGWFAHGPARDDYGQNDGALDGTTAVDIAPAPGPGAPERVVQSVTVHNLDSASATVTIQLDNDGTSRTIIKAVLASGEQLTYDASTGWRVLGTDGSLRTQDAYAASVVSYANGAQDHGNEARTATGDGLTTGLITQGTKNVTVTSASADNIVNLPAAVVGDVINLIVGANGCELRSVTAADKVNDVTVGTTNELALAADSTFRCEYISANTWIVRGFSKAGADLSTLTPHSV